ncbi:serine/threonine-protein kinase [Fimbriiglobus ruber]|uniref:Serine/threonine protein kinase n=1 Tax=Fimbriiglobus ruber TaxID=1908690 RepID=A0A225DEE9_9BACT|nr:serine/threonine-protein kinase [Fimbriiglobus ruber]OWK39920.1 serine/threonine protein kinase [Fimbriiglobus ruber]
MPDPMHPAEQTATKSVADPAVTASGPSDLSAAATHVDDPATRAPVPPTAPSGRYELGDEIAHGGMGAVYRATDTAFGREVAVKLLLDRYGPQSGTARRFADEARITGQLQHPNIPAVFDLGTLPDGRPFLAMKLIKGDTLDALLKARPDPAAERGRFVAAFELVCQAVAYAHAHDVIHRDLKPANVMVGAFGEVQVMDWGLAKVLRTGGDGAADPEATSVASAVVSLRDADDLMTQAGSVLGTPAFMPPEQAVGAVHKVDARSDVFGLGGILAVILTGMPPFAAGSAETTRVKAATGDVADCFARLDACGADPELVALCKRCLSPRTPDRPADAGEVARAVAALRAAADDRARQAELDKVRVEGDLRAADARTAEQRKRRKAQAALGLTFTALVVLGGLFTWWAREQERGRREQAEREVTRPSRRRSPGTHRPAGQTATRPCGPRRERPLSRPGTGPGSPPPRPRSGTASATCSPRSSRSRRTVGSAAPYWRSRPAWATGSPSTATRTSTGPTPGTSGRSATTAPTCSPSPRRRAPTCSGPSAAIAPSS